MVRSSGWVRTFAGHGDNGFANVRKHTDVIGSFWSVSKRRVQKFNGVPKHTFYLHLKENEFRFNHQHENLYKKLLNMLRNNPIQLPGSCVFNSSFLLGKGRIK